MNEIKTTDSTTQQLENGHWFTRQHILILVLIVVTVIAFALCLLVLSPFVTPLAWALALAVVAHPMHAWLEKRIRQPETAAAISVIIVTLILLAPAVFVVHQLVHEAATNIEFVQSPEAAAELRERLETSSFGRSLLWLDVQLDFSSQVDAVRRDLGSRSADFVRQSVWFVANVLITMFTLFFLFRDHREIRAAIYSLVPLSRIEADGIFARVDDTIHATIYGSVLMAALQGLLGGLMFWWLGLPAPAVWGLVMGVLATIPNLGTFVVWAPAAGALALQGEWTKATILAVWGLTAIAMIDNILYPMVVGKRLHMHSLPVFFAILGGLLAFGPAGLILGPVVFAVTDALLEIWRRRTRDGQPAECPTPSLITEPQQIRERAPAALQSEPAPLVEKASR